MTPRDEAAIRVAVPDSHLDEATARARQIAERFEGRYVVVYDFLSEVDETAWVVVPLRHAEDAALAAIKAGLVPDARILTDEEVLEDAEGVGGVH